MTDIKLPPLAKIFDLILSKPAKGPIFSLAISVLGENYDNLSEIKLTVSNITEYTTLTQSASKTTDIVNSVTTSSQTDSDGNIVGDGTSTVVMSKVCDGDHINVVYRLDQSFSEITEQGNLISLRVDEQNTSFAQLQVTADAITSHVENISDSTHKMYSEIVQTATNIKAIVVEDSDSGSVELNKDAFVVAFNGSTNRNATIDRNIGLILGNPDTGSYSQIGYDGKLSMYVAGSSHPYHCLSYTNYIDFECNSDYDDYTPMTDTLPIMFDGIPDDQISVSVSIQKFYKEGMVLPYWMGGYGEVEGGIIKLYGMSAWREYTTNSNDTDEWIESLGNPSDGSIVLRYTVIA